jgi:hypothetical protein
MHFVRSRLFLGKNRGELAMQNHYLTSDEVVWLKRIFESRQNSDQFDHLDIPEGVQDALVAKGLVRRFRNGDLEITLGGIREATRWPLAQDAVAEGQWEASPA